MVDSLEQTDNQPPQPPKKTNFWQSLIRPSKKKTLGITAIASVLGLGYYGAQWWAKRNLPGIIETQAEGILGRPVEIGAIESISFGGVKLNNLVLPPLAGEEDRLEVTEVDIGFNLLPVLFRRTLPVEITLNEPTIYLDQAADGSWLELDLPENEGAGELPIELEIEVKLDTAKITAVPYQQKPIVITAYGTGQYSTQAEQLVAYDLDATVNQAPATLQGQTILETGQTNTKVLVKDLSLGGLAALVPNLPLDLTGGSLNADLDLEIPSWQEITSAEVQGTVSLQQLEGKLETIKQPLTARSLLNFRGQKAEVSTTEATLGDLTAQVKGAIDLEQGYNLDLALLPADLSELQKTFNLELPVPVTGEVSSQITITGAIQQPVIEGKLQNTKPIVIDKEKFTSVQAFFSADKDKAILENLTAIPQAGGAITAEGILETDLSNTLAQGQAINLAQMPLAFDFTANLPTSDLVSTYYALPPEVQVGNLIAEGNLDGTLSNLKALATWQLTEGAIATPNVPTQKVSGQGELLYVENRVLLRDTQLQVGEGTLDVVANADLKQQTWQGAVNSEGIYLTPLLAQLPVGGIDLSRPISLTRTKVDLSGKLSEFALETIQGQADLALDLDGGAIDITSSVTEGVVNLRADTGNLAVHKFVEDLKIPVTTKVTSLLATSELEPLLDIIATKDFSSIESSINADFTVAGGRILTSGTLKNNQWQTQLTGNNIDTDVVVQAYAPELKIASVLQPLATQANFSGSLAGFTEEIVNLPIQVNNTAIQMGQQSIRTSGSLTLTDLLVNPELPLVDLAVQSKINFDSLPLAEVLEQATGNNPLLADRLQVSGNANFVGNFRARNLITDATNLENYSLVGDLRLNDFAFNRIQFDPTMTGSVNIQPSQALSLNLQGQSDAIAATATPCTRDDCLLPYLPRSLELRQGADTTTPILATGQRQGDRFGLEIANFPLALLNLAPARQIGLEGALAGTVTGDITANLFNLATAGQINVAQPAVGYIQADKFAADFAYDPQTNIATAKAVDFDFGNTQYDFQGDLNFTTGKILGRLDLTQGYVQDIFQTLGWHSIEDAIALFNKPNYLPANNINTKPVNTVSDSIWQKLALLGAIEKQIQQIAQAKQDVAIPTELDIRGQYGGTIALDGTINQPEIAFELAGNDWEWQPQNSYLNIVPNLGLVKQGDRIIPIPELLAVGELQGTNLDLEQAKIQIDQSVLSAQGKLSPTVQDASYRVENLTVATIGQFVNIPLDIAARIDTQGTLKGTLEQPNVQGELTVSETAYNGSPLRTTIAGDYTYRDRQLNFQTSQPQEIQLAATIPYPIEPDNNTLQAEVKLEPKAFALIDTLAGDLLTWNGGTGNVDLKATANLDLARQDSPIYNFDAVGIVDLQDAQVTLNTPFFSAPIAATGEVKLHNQTISTENLLANFAQKDLTLVGALPILSPVNNLENPLTVRIPPEGKINIDKLYKGGVAGEIIVTNAALAPTISGRVDLTDGKVSIPQAQKSEVASSNSAANSQAINSNTSKPTQPAIVPTLDNFVVALDDFKLEQAPLYDFGVRGELTLNGTVDNPNNIKPSGTIYLAQGDVNWLSSNFTLVRTRENTIVFSPDKGILDPYVDVQMKTEVSQLDDVRQLASNSNEVSDPLSQVGRSETININLAIDGEVAEIIPTLVANPDNDCNIRSGEISSSNSYSYSQAELDKLANCINNTASDRGNAQQLLDSPAIALSSTPNRREGEIINLLGNQFIGFAEKLQNSNQEELLELGVSQFVLAPIQRRLFYRVEDVVVGAGRKVGLDYLRVYPFFEGIYELNRESSVRGTYDYVFNEVKFEYQKSF